jgi:hypothetical protein
MPLFSRKPKPLPPPSTELPPGEEVERSVRATLLYDPQRIKGALYFTNRRLVFEAQKGDARWMIVPHDEIQKVGLFRYPGAPMGIPSSLDQCLVVTTTKGEQVWWDFDEREEKEWLPLVEARITPSEPDADE